MKKEFLKKLGLVGILSVGLTRCSKTETKPENEPVKRDYFFSDFGMIPSFPGRYTSPVVADFDGDGDIDIVIITGELNRSIIIYENRIPQKKREYSEGK